MTCLAMSSRRRLCGIVVAALIAGMLACADREEDALREIRDLQERGLYAESLERLEPRIASQGEEPEVALLYGRALIELRRPNLAVAPLRQARETPEHAAEAGVLLADALFQSGSTNESIDELDHALEIAPDDVYAWELRARINLARGRFTDALADVERALELDPDRLENQISRTLVLLSLRRFDAAAAALAALTPRVPQGDRESKNLLASLCVARARLARGRQDVEGAREIFASCVAQYPAHPLVVSDALEFYDELGEHERATAVLRGAVEAWPERPRYLTMLAERLRHSGEAEEAERFLQREIERAPSAVTWTALAERYVAEGDFARAAPAYREALVFAKRRGSATERNLQLAYGDTLVQLGDFEGARKLADQLEDDAYADLLHGRILLVEGDAQGALEALERGIRVWPNNAAARYLAGQAAERVGDFERAAREYQASIGADAGQTQAGLALALLYEAQGKTAAAHDAARRYTRTHRGTPEGYVVSMRLAHRLGRVQQVDTIARRLAKLPGGRARAVAERAALAASDAGPAAAVREIADAGLDLAAPENGIALRVLAENLAAQGAQRGALERIDAALAKHPDEAALHTLRGEILERAGVAPSAVRDAYERALALDARDAGALSGLARLAAARQDQEAALGLYERAAAADGTDAAALIESAKISLALGRSDAALRALEGALQREPRNAAAAQQLAQVLLERGSDLERALELAQRAVKFGGDAQAAETLEALQRLRGARDRAAGSAS